MKSLYELLGASAGDDAEALKKAFRKVVKAHHPDLHPDDPDAQARFREIIAAHTVLRDAEQRASYDLLLQFKGDRFSTHARQQFQSKVAPRQRRSKWMFAVGALICCLGLAIMPPTGNVEINKDELAAETGAAVKNQTAIVVTAKENENPSATIAATEAQAAKGGNADEPIEPAGTIVIEHASPADQGERRHEHDSVHVLNGAAEPRLAVSEKNSGVPPDLAKFYRMQGMASYRSGDIAQAIASFTTAILLDPDDAQAYNSRGNAWDEMGDFKSALADYNEAIRIDPNNPAVFHDRAIMWQRKGELEKALIDLDRAIRFSFSDARMYCDRGLVWYEMDHHDRAIADFNQAIKLDANSAAACIQRGLILHRNGEFALASATANQAIRVDPNIFDVLRGARLRP
jgi:Flp pilus assembly protein TadD